MSQIAVPLSEDQVAVMATMLNAFDNAYREVTEARRRLDAYVDQCATLCGVDPKDFEMDWDLKAFVPKKQD